MILDYSILGRIAVFAACSGAGSRQTNVAALAARVQGQSWFSFWSFGLDIEFERSAVLGANALA